MCVSSFPLLALLIRGAFLPIAISRETEYEGCYGTDLLISKVPTYKPKESCWAKCRQDGTQQILVYGIRWCGCPNNGGVMGAGAADCQVKCSFVPNSDCVCFHGHARNYDKTVQRIVSKYISQLPGSNAYQGYNCIDLPFHKQEDVYPSPSEERAHGCISTLCRHENRQYGAYLMGYKCGCKETTNPKDDSFLPVTKDCIERMVCMELPESVCLCGDQVDTMSASSTNGFRPLLKSDIFQCYLMKQRGREAETKRIVEYGIIRKNRVNPSECLDICVSEQYRFAGVTKGGDCVCQNHIGHKTFSDDDCFTPCVAGGTGCGGPYTASVYSFQGHIDLNECKGNSHDCDRVSAVCVNTARSYRCECRLGYRHHNRTHCLDADECSENSHDCDRQTTYCINTMGSFLCECAIGFERLDRAHCIDIDECNTHQNNCGENMKCINTIGSFRCECLPGFNMRGRRCEDIDECVDNMNDCDRSSTYCHNTAGSYLCECRVGYEQLDNIRCKDIDECYTGHGDCGAIMECINTIGSYTCDCVPGYTKAGDNCRDVDECAQLSHDCDRSSTDCTNTAGSYQCICKVGYQKLDRTRCVDVDECQTHQEKCARCTNTVGSYLCDCIAGYRMSTSGCKDVDECLESPKVCSSNSDCENTVGGYHCNCHPGYTRDQDSNTNCIDVNECLEVSVNNCRAPHSRCLNTEGSYTCPCDWGFSGDGRSQCVDDDECGDGRHDCALHAACSNTVGSFSCTCKPGYAGNGRSCKEVISLEDLQSLLDEEPKSDKTPIWVEQHKEATILENSKPEKLSNRELEILFNEVTELPNLDDAWMGDKFNADIRSLSELLDSVENDLPDGTDKQNGDTEANLDIMLDEIVEHQKTIVDKARPEPVDKNSVPQTPRELGKVGSETKQDPYILETVNAVMDSPRLKNKAFLSNAVVPDQSMLEQILGDRELLPKGPKVTETNLDMILDKIIIHEEGLVEGNTQPSPTHTTIQKYHKRPMQLPMGTIIADTQKTWIPQTMPRKIMVTKAPVAPPDTSHLETSDDLYDITEEMLEASDSGPWLNNDEELTINGGEGYGLPTPDKEDGIVTDRKDMSPIAEPDHQIHVDESDTEDDDMEDDVMEDKIAKHQDPNDIPDPIRVK